MEETEKLLVDVFVLGHTAEDSAVYRKIGEELDNSEKKARRKFGKTKSPEDKKAVVRAILAQAMLCKLVHHNMEGYQHQMFVVLPKFINSNSENWISPQVITEYAIALVRD